MNREEAKLILQVCRPGGQDANDPQFAEALVLLKNDAELAAWFTDQQKFDAFASRNLKSVSVPPDLKAKILVNAIPERQKIVELTAPVWWRNLFRSPVSWATAAAVMIFLGLVIFLKQPENAAHFADFSAQMVHAAEYDTNHVDIENSDMKQVLVWLGEHQGENKFVLPAVLNGDEGLVGCRVLEWRGHKVSMLCYGLKNSGHVDLFVARADVFSDTPPVDAPRFAKNDGTPTASWSHDGHVYLMVGHGDMTDLEKILQPEKVAQIKLRTRTKFFLE